jgi:hypothetical protein
MFNNAWIDVLCIRDHLGLKNEVLQIQGMGKSIDLRGKSIYHFVKFGFPLPGHKVNQLTR